MSALPLPERLARRPLGWAAALFAAAAALLVPWIVLRVRALPSAHRASHWDVAWGGFDVALAAVLAAWRRSRSLESAATARATLLFVDAWFDLLTSSTRAAGRMLDR